MSSALFRKYINKLAGIDTETGDYNVYGNITVLGNGSVIRGASNLSPISTTDISGNIVGNFISVSANVQTRSGVFIGNGTFLTGTGAASIPKTVVADVTGNISGNSATMSGNISANYFFGDGSGLTGLVTFIPRAGNINIQGNIFATGNVDAANISTGLLRVQGNLNITNNWTTTGNMSALYFIGDGSNILGINASPPASANLNIIGNVTSSGNVDAANVTVSTSATIGNLNVTGGITSSGNISARYLFGNASNITTTLIPTNVSMDIVGNVTATGNVRASNLIGNAFGMYFSGNLITVQGNVANTSSRLALTNIPLGGLVNQLDTNSQYLLAYQPPSVNTNWVPLTGTNFPVTSAFGRQGAVVLVSGVDIKTIGGVPIVGNGDISSANIDIVGNITGNIQTNRLSVGNLISNVVTVTGQVTALTANLISNVLIGNGFFLVGTPASIPTVGNIDIQGNVVSLGNVVAGNISTGTLRITNGNLNVTQQATIVGNVSANFFYGNGSLMTNANVGNATGTVSTDIIGNVTASANVNAANVSTGLLRVNANTQILGQLQAIGNIVASFFIGNGAAITGVTTSTGNSKCKYNRKCIFYRECRCASNVSAGIVRSGNTIVSGQVNIIGNVVTSSLIGDGSNLFGLRASGLQRINIIGNVFALGNVDAANVSATALTAGNIISTGQVNVIGNVTALTFIGNGSALTGIIATLSGSRNINITGNVSAPGNVDAANVSTSIIRINANADVSGQVAITGNIIAPFFIGNGVGISNVIIGGLQTVNIIGNVASTGNVDATNITANILRTNGNAVVTGQVNTTGKVISNYLIGNGLGLTNVVASAGVPTSFVQPSSGFLSNVAGVVSYNGTLSNAWLITLSVSVPRFITVRTPNLPPNTTSPFTTLPSGVGTSLANAWVYGNGVWQGTFRCTASSTFSEISNNFVFNYHTSYGTFNGQSSETFCRAVA
uniref:Vp260 like protein n=1 Tax=Chlorella virus TaxID=10507 RepID=Q8V7J7_9PHYC|nr:Vp260 like protein [Chlorella virus]